jgi:two-component system, LytTR family, sensor histidine kinase AlgZ
MRAMTRRRRRLPYVLAFLTAAATTLMLTSPAEGWRSIAVTFIFGIAYATCIGCLGWLILPRVGSYSARMGPVMRWTIVVIVTIAIAIVGSLIALALMSAAGFIPWSSFWIGFWRNLRFTIVISIAIGVSISLFESMRYRLQYEATQARLSSLESRLHPHFLFNTLNSISALIPEDPAAAERMTERLAALLRFSLDSTDRQTVPLEHELKITIDYLEIEKTRFGPRLNYSIDVPAELMRVEVPPFSLQTLVENSVKYGGGEIRVSARNGNDRVELNVWDSGTGFATQKEIPAGHGLSNLRSRLEAIWGVNSRLEFGQENSGANVRISLPMRPAR